MTVPDLAAAEVQGDQQALNQESPKAQNLGLLVGKQVSVAILTGSSSGQTTGQNLAGILIAADPVTKSVILVTKSAEEGDISVKVVPFATKVKAEDEIEPDPLLVAFANKLISKASLQKNSPQGEAQALASRKTSVKEWLESNLLEVTEEGPYELVVQGCVKLSPPYSSRHDCEATNEIILSRVVELISIAPDSTNTTSATTQQNN